MCTGFLNKLHSSPSHLSQVYIEDAVTDRLWVDLPPCSKFVDNICTIFQTRLPSAVLGGAAPTPPAAAGGEGNVGGSGSKPAEQDATPMEAEEVKVEQGGVELCTEDIDVEPRCVSPHTTPLLSTVTPHHFLPIHHLSSPFHPPLIHSSSRYLCMIVWGTH